MRDLRVRAFLLLSSLLSTVAATAASAQAPAQAQAPIAFDAVEEDWVLVVATPDPDGVGPQITTCMSPVGDKSAPFVAFDMNYREYPQFSPGGMQLQVWSSGNVLATSSQGLAVFNTPGETVSWTQRMELDGGTINYDINNGQSVTWGNFGQGSRLSVSYPSGVTTLTAYSPDVSARNSGVTWESNNVTSLTLAQVRYYLGGVLVQTDTTPRPVVAPNPGPGN
jgi:hypothetical protein